MSEVGNLIVSGIIVLNKLNDQFAPLLRLIMCFPPPLARAHPKAMS